MNHPLKVYHPFGGVFYLLNWNNSYDGGHVVLARSETAINASIKTISKSDSNATVLSYQKIEILAPSEEACIKATEFRYKEKVDFFFRIVCYRLHDLISAKIELPKIFSKCQDYQNEPQDEIDEQDDFDKQGRIDQDEIDAQKHYGCINCIEGIKLTSLTYEQFYEKYNEIYSQEIYKHNLYIDPNLVFSSAKQASPSEKLWYVNMQHGLYVNEFESDYIPNNVLFYFKSLESFDKDQFSHLFENAKKAFNLKRKEDEKLRNEEREVEEKETLEKILNIFMEI